MIQPMAALRAHSRRLKILAAEAISSDPFLYLVLPGFLASTELKRLKKTFPRIVARGDYPVKLFKINHEMEELITELKSKRYTRILESKFGVKLKGTKLRVSVRGWSGKEDGSIHTDHPQKVLTMLLYFNSQWRKRIGKLRFLTSKNIDDFFLEIPPHGGTLVIFKRSDRSFHGYLPHVGRRLVLQLAWIKQPFRQFRGAVDNYF